MSLQQYAGVCFLIIAAAGFIYSRILFRRRDKIMAEITRLRDERSSNEQD